ncbi:MAG: hypothetical protein FJ029_10795 [Actinobacteria bacterium]|nr:hypothetical protein [Actinomycetota bacterium]
MKERSVVGDLINFRGLVYSPINEQGVVYLFSKVAEDLNMYVEEVKQGFPDCVARRFNGKGWERIAIEFEYQSSNFQAHGHNPAACDMIVCWEHDWLDAPIEVMELRDVVRSLPNRPIERPERVSGDAPTSVEELCDRAGSKPEVRQLATALDVKIRAIHADVWRKIGKGWATYYSPKRVYVWLTPQVQGIRLEVFTRGQPLEPARPYRGSTTTERWGVISVRSANEIDVAVAACAESRERMNAAIAANEPLSGALTAGDMAHPPAEAEETNAVTEVRP